MDHKIVKYEPQFKDRVLALLQRLWGPYLQRNAHHFEWKFEQNPYLNGPQIYLVIHDNEVVGVRGMFGSKWKIESGDRELVIPLSCDTIIAPEHRKFGLLEKLTEFALRDLADQGYPFVGIVSAGRATHFQAVLTGWHCLGGYENYSRPSPVSNKSKALRGYFLKQPSIGAFVRKHIVAPLYRVTNDESQTSSRLFELFSRGGTSLEIEGTEVSIEGRPRSARMSQLADQCGDRTRVRHVRDEPYFEWRYTNPKRSYCFLFIGRERLEGYMVLQAGTSPFQSDATIVDIMAINLEVWRKLISAAIKNRGSFGYAVWTVSFNAAQRQILRENGFVADEQPTNVARTGPGLLLKPTAALAQTEPQIELGNSAQGIENWDIHMIDSDHR